MKHLSIILSVIGLFATIIQYVNTQNSFSSPKQSTTTIISNGTTIKTRFATPKNYLREAFGDSTFASYLRLLPLKKAGSLVKMYDGTSKTNYNVYDAVIDLPIGNKDLHQCADAVMRLRAEYLYKFKYYDKISFNFTNGFKAQYKEWMKGKRISVKGNSVNWVNGGKASTSYSDFWNYLEMVFSYAGTLSLSKQLKSVPINEMQIGDVLIQGGSPGHAVIVVDMAVHTISKQKIYLLAQSYMPAQEIQVLKNPSNELLSPWYALSEVEIIHTPEWQFTKNDLKRFE